MFDWWRLAVCESNFFKEFLLIRFLTVLKMEGNIQKIYL